MKKIFLIGLILILFLAGCASSRHALTGAALGGVAGMIICRGNPNCGWLGAAVGGVLGNEADQFRIDKQREAYWQKRTAMHKAATENAVKIIEVDEDTEVIFVNEKGEIQKY